MTGFAIFCSEISGFPISFAEISGFVSFHSDISGFEDLFRSSIILYFASDIAVFFTFSPIVLGSFTFSYDIFHKYTPREISCARWHMKT